MSTLNEALPEVEEFEMGAFLSIWINEEHPELIDEFAEYVAERFTPDEEDDENG